MNTQSPKSMRVTLLIAGIAAILFTTVAMAIMPIRGWLHSSFEYFDGIFAQAQFSEIPEAPLSAATSGTGPARVKARCTECGVIDSIRQIQPVGNSLASYEITVRFGNGSTRVLSDARPANWRPGERIQLIGGSGL